MEGGTNIQMNTCCIDALEIGELALIKLESRDEIKLRAFLLLLVDVNKCTFGDLYPQNVTIIECKGYDAENVILDEVEE